MTLQPHQRRDDIDGLRAVSLLLVVFYHAGFHISRGFFVGVDLFFVISGYFIALGLLRDLDRDRFSLAGFYLRRLWRILPPLAVMALGCIIPAYLWATPQDFVQFGKTLLSVLTFVSNYFFYSQGGYFDAPLEGNPFLHTWFLSVQVQFYLVFPLVFTVIARRFPRRITVIVAALLLASLALSETAVRHLPSAAYFLLFSRFWELMIGSLAAILCYKGALRPGTLSRPTAEVIGWTAVAAIAACGFAYSPSTPFPGLAALPVCLGAAVLIVLPHCAAVRPSVSALLAFRPAVAIGLISYSVYLWHWPVFVYFKDGLMVESLPRNFKFLAILVSFVLGLVSWALLERGLGNAKSLGARARAAILLGPVLAAAVVLATLSASHGLPTRFPPEARPYIDVLEESRESAVAGAAVQINDMTPASVDRVRRGDIQTLGAADAAPAFLAWGDSHVYHLGTFLGRMAEENSLSGLFLPTPGHPPLLDVYRERWDATATQRESYMGITRAAVALVKERNIPVVFLGGYWRFYAELDLVAPLADGSVRTGYEALAEGLFRTIEALEAAGSEVWILRLIPAYPVSVPRMMMRTLRAGGDPAQFRVSAREHADKDAAVREVMDEAARRFPNVKFIDPVPTLCPDGECLPAVDNTPLYFDDNHLSKFGALFLAPAFSEFTEAVKARTK